MDVDAGQTVPLPAALTRPGPPQGHIPAGESATRSDRSAAGVGVGVSPRHESARVARLSAMSSAYSDASDVMLSQMVVMKLVVISSD